MTLTRFECENCGQRKEILDAIVTSIPCECGSLMRISVIFPARKPMAPKNVPVVNPNDELTSLMSLALGGGKPPKTLKKFKIVQCPNCGAVQVTQARKACECFYCGKRNPFRVKGMWNLNLWETDDWQEAVRVCQEQKMMRPPKHQKYVEKRGVA